MHPHLAIVDDRPEMNTGLLKALADRIDGLAVSCVTCGFDAVQCLRPLAAAPPQAFMLDILLPWSRDEAQDEPEDYMVLEGGFYVAEAIRATPRLARVPIVFYSTADHWPQHITSRFAPSYLMAKHEPDRKVADFLTSLVSAQVPIERPKKRALRMLADATELKVGKFGLEINVIQLLKELSESRER